MKRSLTEEVAQQRSTVKKLTHPCIRPSIKSFDHCFIHWFTDSFVFIAWFGDSRLRGFIDLLIHWFFLIVPWVVYSLIHRFIGLWIGWFVVLLCFVNPLPHWFVEWLLHCMQSLIDRFTTSLIRWFIDSLLRCVLACLIPWFIDRVIDWLIDWLVRSIYPSSRLSIHLSIHPSIHSFILPSIDWLSDWLILASLIHCFIGSLAFKQLSVDSSCHFIGISATICLFVDAPHNFNTSLLLHLKNFPIGSYRSYRQSSSYTVAVSFFWTLPSRGVPGTIW